MALVHIVPDVAVLLALAPEELAFSVLQATPAHQQNNMFRLEGLKTHEIAGMAAVQTWGYGQQRENEVDIAVAEAWRWLEFNMFILPAPDGNGRNGWYVLGRRGKARLTAAQFADYTKAAKFPRDLIHPAIADQVWILLARGDFSIAVFVSFRAVEEAVRVAGGYTANDIGTDLMRKAFDAARGPLRKPTDPTSEREALAHLFAGAIGSYKNSHSHRTVALTDAGEAQEMVMLASHLLRIVDARRP